MDICISHGLVTGNQIDIDFGPACLHNVRSIWHISCGAGTSPPSVTKATLRNKIPLLPQYKGAHEKHFVSHKMIVFVINTDLSHSIKWGYYRLNFHVGLIVKRYRPSLMLTAANPVMEVQICYITIHFIGVTHGINFAVVLISICDFMYIYTFYLSQVGFFVWQCYTSFFLTCQMMWTQCMSGVLVWRGCVLSLLVRCWRVATWSC